MTGLPIHSVTTVVEVDPAADAGNNSPSISTVTASTYNVGFPLMVLLPLFLMP
jgi:hypothetical protein